MIRRMSHALLVQFDDVFGPGRLGPLLRDFGIPTRSVRLDRGETPGDLDEVRLLVLLGSSSRVAEIAEGKCPEIKPVLDAAKMFIDADRPTVGIGFGAELLCHATGAKVTVNRKPGPTPDQPGDELPEFGWIQLTFPFPGCTEPAVFGMVDGTPMFAWHRDTFALPTLPPPANPPPPPARPPTGNVLLASSRACRNQAFKFKNRIFGYQFHFELDRDQINKIIDTLGRENGVDANALRTATETHYARYERAGTKLIENLVQFLKSY